MMNNKKQLFELIKNEIQNFKELEFNSNIVPSSIPILWFGSSEKYFLSDKKNNYRRFNTQVQQVSGI